MLYNVKNLPIRRTIYRSLFVPLRSLNFKGDPKTINYFDPANGSVPPGYKNDAGTTVTIGPGHLDFGSDQGGNLYTANFTDNQLTITEDEDGDPVPPFIMTFTDPAFPSITKVFDNFDHGGISFRLVGDTIILSRNRDVSLDDHYAIFDIGTASPPPPVPEPGSILLLGTGLLSAAGFLHHKRSAKRVGRKHSPAAPPQPTPEPPDPRRLWFTPGRLNRSC